MIHSAVPRVRDAVDRGQEQAMELTGSGEPTVEKLHRLVGVQGDLVQSHAARIAASEAGLGPPTLRATIPACRRSETWRFGDEHRPEG